MHRFAAEGIYTCLPTGSVAASFDCGDGYRDGNCDGSRPFGMEMDAVINALPFVSVIIPVHNDGDRLSRCLTALYHQSYPYCRYEVIVVDNNSTEDIPNICRPFSNIRYCQESKPGNNAARNCGIGAARGDIFAITDADCIPDANWIRAGVRSLQRHPTAGIIGGHIQFFFQGQRPTPVEYVDRVSYLQQAVYVMRDHYAAGANLFTRRAVVEQVGRFDDRLLNLGDKEFGQRVYGAGWEIEFSAEAIVFHPARTTLEQLLSKARRQTRANIQLCTLTGQKLPNCGFLPMEWRFFQTVLGDANLPSWREKIAFIWVMHRVKWAIGWESPCSK
jgi:glycosyltransferase involved in cell wall biosynthesis